MSDYDDLNEVSYGSRAWGIFTALLKAAAGVAILIASDYIVAFSMYYMKIDSYYYNGLYATLSSVITIVGLFIFSRVEGQIFNKRKSNLIRFKKPTGVEVVTALLVAFALLMIVTVYMLIARLISEYQTVVKEAVQQYDESIETYKPAIVYPAWDQLLYVFAITILIPVAEEFTFRGVVYGAVNRRLNGAWAIGISAGVFGILHGLSVHIGYALISGVLIGLAYYAFDSIFVTIIIHAVFNFFGSGIYYLADVLRINRNDIPTAFTLELILTLPALALLFTAVGNRMKQNKGITTGVFNEQA